MNHSGDAKDYLKQILLLDRQNKWIDENYPEFVWQMLIIFYQANARPSCCLAMSENITV